MWPSKNPTAGKTNPREFYCSIYQAQKLFTATFISALTIPDFSIFVPTPNSVPTSNSMPTLISVPLVECTEWYRQYGIERTVWIYVLEKIHFSSKIVARNFSSKNVPLLYRMDCTEQYNSTKNNFLENCPAPWDLCPLEKTIAPWDLCPLEKNCSSLSFCK